MKTPITFPESRKYPTVQIVANYSRIRDVYQILWFTPDGGESHKIFRNGNEVADFCKNALGIEISYNFSERTFSIPKENDKILNDM